MTIARPSAQCADPLGDLSAQSITAATRRYDSPKNPSTSPLWNQGIPPLSAVLVSSVT